MAFDPKFRIGREEYYVPSNSTYVWNNADLINSYFDQPVFSVLIEKKQDSNDPDYYLSSSIAYDDAALERVKEPLRAALIRKIAAVNLQQPNTFISHAELDAMKFPHVRLITAQWVIFNQAPHTMDPLSLSITSHENGTYYDLHPVLLSGSKDVVALHTKYTLLANSMANPGDYYMAGLYVGSDDYADRWEAMKASVPGKRDQYKLRSVDEFGLVELHYLAEDALGITPSPVTIIHDDGTNDVLESFNIDDGVKINFMMFGLIKPPRQEMMVYFPDPAISPLRYYPDGARHAEPLAEPPAMSGMLRHLLDILETNGTWPQREVPKRNLFSRVMHRVFGLGE